MFFSEIKKVLNRIGNFFFREIRLSFLLLFIATSVYSQSNVVATIDSLELLLPKSSDTIKAKILNDLTWYYRTINQSKAIEYGKQAIDFSARINFNKGLSQGYNDLAILYTDKREYSKSILLLTKALKIRKLQKDELGIAAIYNKLGIINQEQGNINKALEFQFQALTLFEKLNVKSAIGNSLNNIAILFYNNNDNGKSKYYHKKAIEIRTKIGDNIGLAASYLNIGNILMEENEYKGAYDNYKKSELLLRKSDDTQKTATALNNLSSICILMNKTEDAFSYAMESYTMRKKINDLKGVASTALNLAQIYSIRKKYIQAKKYIDEAYSLSVKSDIKPERTKAYDAYSKLYEKLGKFDLALEYNRKFIQLNDSILNQDINKQMAEMSTKFEVEKKENDNKRLAAENNLKTLEIKRKQQVIYFSITGFFLLIAFVVLLYNRNKHKQEKLFSEELLKLEKMRMKAIINTQEQERKRIAEELHDGIGQMMSVVKMNVSSLEVVEIDKNHFIKTLKLIDDSCDELRTISHTMMPSALSKLGLIPAIKELVYSLNDSKKINIILNVNITSFRFDEMVEVNLYRVLQELLQNIIKYAHATEVTLQINPTEELLSIQLTDNGIGFDISTLDTSIGNGWSNIKSRLATINASYQIVSKKGNGTHVKIELVV